MSSTDAAAAAAAAAPGDEEKPKRRQSLLGKLKSGSPFKRMGRSESSDGVAGSPPPAAAGAAGSPPPPPTAEGDEAAAQMESLMEQLAHISQQLADARMSKVELDEDNRRLEGQVGDLHILVKDKDAKLQAMRDKVVFENVEHVEKEARRLREENAALETRAAAAEKRGESLAKKLEAKTARLAEAEKRGLEVDAALEEAGAALAREREEAVGLRKRLEEAEARAAREEARAGAAEAEAEAARAGAAEAASSVERELTARHEEERAELQRRVDDMESQRNGFRHKAESASKELNKVVKQAQAAQSSDSRFEKENAALREELERRSKSLQDALEALSVYMQQSDVMEAEIESKRREEAGGAGAAAAGGVAGSRESPPPETVRLANMLTVTVNEKEDIVSNLRTSNQALGRRVLELEEKLRDYEDLP